MHTVQIWHFHILTTGTNVKSEVTVYITTHLMKFNLNCVYTAALHFSLC